MYERAQTAYAPNPDSGPERVLAPVPNRPDAMEQVQHAEEPVPGAPGDAGRPSRESRRRYGKAPNSSGNTNSMRRPRGATGQADLEWPASLFGVP
jgi:hypothetical protein